MIKKIPSPAVEDPLRRVFRKAFEQWQAIQPQDLVIHTRKCAIPLSADHDLLQQIIGESELQEVISALLEMEFAEWQDKKLQFHPVLRSIIMESWISERPEIFVQTNQEVLHYYRNERNKLPIYEQPTMQREVLYHTFLDDETEGLHQFRQVYEDLLDRRLLGTAEEVIDAVNAIASWLSTSTQHWVQYYGAMLDWAYNNRKQAVQKLERLKTEGLVTTLEALVDGQIAESMVIKGQWAQAIELLFRCRDVLKNAGSDRDAAKLTLALGKAYLNLAEHSGGYRPVRPLNRTWLNRFLELLNNLPFILYRWLIRRVGFLWTPLTHSPNFQDWIVAYLIILAARQFRQADRVFSQIKDHPNIVQTNLARARLELIKGRWSRAENLFNSLLEKREVLISDYRTALVWKGLGTLSYIRRDYVSAVKALHKALQIFLKSKDLENEITTGELLGRAQYRLGNTKSAVHSFQETLKTAQLFQENQFSATRIIWNLEDILRETEEHPQEPLPPDWSRQVRENLANNQERTYLTRFGVNLLQRFRRIALLVALPLSFPLAILLGVIFVLSVVTISESLVVLVIFGDQQFSILNYLIFLVGVILPGPVALWLYRFLYTRTGGFYVRYLGKEIDPIQGDQPQVIQTNPETIMVTSHIQEKVNKLSWKSIRKIDWVGYSIWRKPIGLLSTLYLLAKDETFTIQGITDGFEKLKKSLYKWLPKDVNQTYLEFSFLRSKSILNLGITTLVIAFLSSKFIGTIYISATPKFGEPRELFFSSVLASWLLLLLFTLPAVTMVRLLSFRKKLHRITLDIHHSISDKALNIAAASSFIFLLVGLVLFVLLSLGEAETTTVLFFNILRII